MSDYADLVGRIEAIVEEIDDRAFGELTEAVAARAGGSARVGQAADAGAARPREGGDGAAFDRRGGARRVATQPAGSNPLIMSIIVISSLKPRLEKLNASRARST